MHVHMDRNTWQETELQEAICDQAKCILSCSSANYTHGQSDSTADSVPGEVFHLLDKTEPTPQLMPN